MPGRRQINFLPINKNRVIEFGPGLVVTGNYFGSYRGARTEVTTIDAAGGSTCPLPMTRAALIALRNASGLTKDCDYVVTDHVQGRLVAGTQIHLQAVSANKLSENVSVNTTYDNEAWAGIYDLDRGIVLELHDNRNNVARGANGTEVSNFDWGNTNITSTTVDSATWTHTIGSPRIVSDLTVKAGATLTTTGWVAGSITGGTLIEGFGTNVNMTNANVSILAGSFSNITSLNMASFTAGSTISRFRLSSCAFNFSNSTSPVNLAIVTAVGSTLNHVGVTTGAITGTNLTMSNTSVISHNAGAGNMSLNRADLVNQANLTHSAGTLSVTDYSLSDGANIQQTGTGNTSVNSGFMDGQASIVNNSASSVIATRYTATSNGSVNIQAGAAGTVTLTGTTNNSGSILKNGTSTAGNLTITTTVLTNTALVQQTGTGNVNISDSEISSNSRVTLTGVRGLTVTRCDFRNLAQITQSGSAAAVDTIVDSHVGTRGIIALSSSGAAAHVISYYIGEGLGGNLNISGTSTGQFLNRVKASAATFNFTNNTISNSYSNMTAVDGCTATFQNMAVAKTFNNVSLLNSAVLNVNAPTGVGTVQGLSSIDGARINVSGTAGAGNGIYAKERATITFNGGGVTNISKQMVGVLTTGNFTHNNVVVINPINVTLTANNTNRSSYLGVVSSVPLI
jgi:hypothetical protein